MPDDPIRIGPVNLGTVSALLYTAPAATDTVLRSIRVANVNEDVAWITLTIGPDSINNVLFFQVEIPIAGVLDWSGFMPLEAGDTIEAYSDKTPALTVTIGAVEIT